MIPLFLCSTFAVSWRERLAARVGEEPQLVTTAAQLGTPAHERLATRVGGEPQLGTIVAQLGTALVVHEVIVKELSRFLSNEVEPALAILREHEQQLGSAETCFATAGGEHLRFQCCVYYSTLAAAMLEKRYSSTRDGTSSLLSHTSIHGLLASWFLQPPEGAAPAAVIRAAGFVAQAGRQGGSLEDLRLAAKQLPGPLGRYSVTLSILGINGAHVVRGPQPSPTRIERETALLWTHNFRRSTYSVGLVAPLQAAHCLAVE